MRDGGRFSTDAEAEASVRKPLKSKALRFSGDLSLEIDGTSTQRARFELHLNYTGGEGRNRTGKLQCSDRNSLDFKHFNRLIF
jgi:hypothetical protein